MEIVNFDNLIFTFMRISPFLCLNWCFFLFILWSEDKSQPNKSKVHVTLMSCFSFLKKFKFEEKYLFFDSTPLKVV